MNNMSTAVCELGNVFKSKTRKYGITIADSFSHTNYMGTTSAKNVPSGVTVQRETQMQHDLKITQFI